MEKKDLLSLQSKYSYLSDYEERYRKELLDFVREAFEKHGGVFEYKCPTHGSWKEAEADGNYDFDAMNDLPTCMTIWVDDDGGHEVYPVRIEEIKGCESLFDNFEVECYDWYDCEWQSYSWPHLGIDNLRSIADFIHAVLEQEREEIV